MVYLVWKIRYYKQVLRKFKKQKIHTKKRKYGI